jgi:hypothetical protein
MITTPPGRTWSTGGDELPGGDADVVVGVNRPADLHESKHASESLHGGTGLAEQAGERKMLCRSS